MTTLDPVIYRRAAEVITATGLAKGSFAQLLPNGYEAHCIVGALRVAAGRRLANSAPEIEYLTDLLGGEAIISVWNDRPHTTKADVIGLLTEAAEKLEADR